MNPVATLRGLSVDGRARTPFAWALYDFANTIFSFAVISNAIGLLLTDGLGDSAGNLWLGVASAAAWAPPKRRPGPACPERRS